MPNPNTCLLLRILPHNNYHLLGFLLIRLTVQWICCTEVSLTEPELVVKNKFFCFHIVIDLKTSFLYTLEKTDIRLIGWCDVISLGSFLGLGIAIICDSFNFCASSLVSISIYIWGHQMQNSLYDQNQDICIIFYLHMNIYNVENRLN